MNKIIILLMLSLSTFYLSAEEKKDNKMTTQEHIQMHEMMLRAHRDAADCLREGIKTTDQCRENFLVARDKACGDKKCKEHMHKEHGMHKEGKATR